MERRLAAILAADVVAFSRLMREDEAGTLDRLKTLRRDLVQPKIIEHEGRIFKLMGDGLLAEFPSAVKAVECGVEIQKAMEKREHDKSEEGRIRLRIGVNLGDIIVEGRDIYGDGVNIAARLQEIGDPNGVCLSDATFQQVRGRIVPMFEDGGEVAMKNFAEPMRVWRWLPNNDSATNFVKLSEPVPGFGDRPAIAVLPFDNLSRDPEQEFLADGIAEDILTRLAMWRWLPVIARNSSFTYKGRNVDVKNVGRELGARYVLEGSIRRAGNRIRVSGQLIDSETGHHVWADRFDHDLDDVFALQDAITDAVVAALEPAVGRAEMQRAQRKDPTNIDAWALYHRGIAELTKATRDGLDTARDLFNRSIKIDPSFAPPYAALAIANFVDKTIGYTVDSEAMMASAYEAALKAVSLDDLDPVSHAGLAYSGFSTGNHDSAVAAGRRAIELNPSFALGHHALGASLFASGEQDEAVEVVSKAIRISPNDPWLYFFYGALSASLYMRRDYADSADVSGRAVKRFPWYPSTLRWQAIALAQLDRVDEAHQALKKFLELAPHYSMDVARNSYYFRRQADLDHFLEGHRKAGLED